MLGTFPSLLPFPIHSFFILFIPVTPSRAHDRIPRILTPPTSIGRVTQAVLAPISTTVDAIEPIAKFTKPLSAIFGVGKVFASGLEDWRPEPGDRYDVVWNQWCVGHLTDDDLVGYLVRCKGALAEEGFIVVKENLSTKGVDVYDAVDSSVTR